jgi:hypothetical protein
MVKCVICCDNNTDFNTKCHQCKKSVCKHCYSQIVFNETNHLNHMITNINCYDKLHIKYCCPFCKLKADDKIEMDNLCLKCVMTSNSLYVLKLERKVKKMKSDNRTEIALEDSEFENMMLREKLEDCYLENVGLNHQLKESRFDNKILKDRLKELPKANINKTPNELIDSIYKMVVGASKSKLKEAVLKELSNAYSIK